MYATETRHSIAHTSPLEERMREWMCDTHVACKLLENKYDINELCKIINNRTMVKFQNLIVFIM